MISSITSLFVAVIVLLTNVVVPPSSTAFAIKCVGTAQFEDNARGKVSKRHYDLPPQVYVFDPVSRRAELALEPRQQFEPICFKGGYLEEIDFSPGLIAVRSEAPGKLCDFRVSRRNGKGEYFSQEDLGANLNSKIQYRLSCARSQIPQFDTNGNRF